MDEVNNINIEEAIFEKKDDTTLRIVLPPPTYEVKLDDLLSKKADYEVKIKDVEERKTSALNNWDSEIAGHQKEIDKIDKLISQCSKVEVQSEKVLEAERQAIKVEEESVEKPLVNEDEVVPKEI